MLKQRMQEGFFIFSCAVSLFFLLALMSYHKTDLIIHTRHIFNWGGRTGAYLALFFFSYFWLRCLSIPFLTGLLRMAKF